MKKLRLIYVFSLVILAFLLVYNSWSLFQEDDTLPRSLEQKHIDLDGGDIVFNFNLQNREGRELDHTYYFFLNDELLEQGTFPISKAFGYGIHFNPGEGEMIEGRVAKYRLVIYREGETDPVADITRYIRRIPKGGKWTGA